MPEPEVLLDLSPGGVAVLTLNRPSKQNAVNTSLLVVLANHLQQLGLNDQVKAVVIAGNETGFSRGADVTEMIARMPMDPTFEANRHCWKAIESFPKPKIAAVAGQALGGGAELALLCDIVIAGRNSQFGFPEVNLGIMTGIGGVQRLTRLSGHARAMRWLLTGEIFDVQTAYELGMVSEIVDDDDVLEHAESLAHSIAAKSPLAVTSIISCGKLAHNIPLDAGLEMDRQAFKLLLSTEDGREGLSAFVQNRTAKFVGR